MNSTNQTECPKSKPNRSDFRHCPKSELFRNGTKTKNAKIRTFGFQTLTVERLNWLETLHLFQGNVTVATISFWNTNKLEFQTSKTVQFSNSLYFRQYSRMPKSGCSKSRKRQNLDAVLSSPNAKIQTN